jgi:ribosomal protein L15
VSLKKLETLPENTVVTLATLRKANLIARTDRSAKIVGSEVAKKFVVDGVAVSASARQAIEKAGGKVTF